MSFCARLGTFVCFFSNSNVGQDENIRPEIRLYAGVQPRVHPSSKFPLGGLHGIPSYKSVVSRQ